MKYILTITISGILAASSMGFADTNTPQISDLRVVNEQVTPPSSPSPEAWRWGGYGRWGRWGRWGGYYGRGYGYYGGYYGHHYGRYYGRYYYGRPAPEGSLPPEAIPSPQVPDGE